MDKVECLWRSVKGAVWRMIFLNNSVSQPSINTYKNLQSGAVFDGESHGVRIIRVQILIHMWVNSGKFGKILKIQNSGKFGCYLIKL